MAEASDRDADGIYTGPGTKVIPLITPVKRDGTTDLVEITLQEPNAKQLSAYLTRVNQTNDDGVHAMTNLIADCSGVAPPDVEKLKQRDHDKCASWLILFTKVLPKPTTAA